jgi:hypothetical protein
MAARGCKPLEEKRCTLQTNFKRVCRIQPSPQLNWPLQDDHFKPVSVEEELSVALDFAADGHVSHTSITQTVSVMPLLA